MILGGRGIGSWHQAPATHHPHGGYFHDQWTHLTQNASFLTLVHFWEWYNIGWNCPHV